MPGSFRIVSEAVGAGMPGRPGHLYFALTPGAKPSKAELRLQNDCEVVAAALRAHFALETDSFRASFTELLALAQVGLVGGTADQVAASNTLAGFKDRLVSTFGPALRSKYLSALGRRAGLFALGFIVLALGLMWMKARWATVQGPDMDFAINCCWALTGAMGGLWISFAARRRFLFEELFMPADDLLAPFHRVVFVAACTALLALMCSMKIASASIGTFSTDNIGTNWRTALGFGAFSGIGERYLSNTVVPLGRRVLAKLGSSQGKNEQDER